MGTILVPLFAHHRLAALLVQAALGAGLPNNRLKDVGVGNQSLKVTVLVVNEDNMHH